MKSDDFLAGSPGRLVSTTGGALAFVPNPLPPVVAVSHEMQAVSEEAVLALGELRAIVPSLPNPELITTPFLRREAVLSSRIEGTHTEIQELYLFEINEPKHSLGQVEGEELQDAREVANYVKALEYGLEQFEKIPICHRLLKDMHRMLMREVRGVDKTPGEYRKCQNFVGRGRDILQARFVPPPKAEMEAAMDELEKYINVGKDFPSLVRIATIHYQFETIHPFGDGNGRIGRLLISLLLAAYRLLPEPLLYLSAYFERNRDEYNDCLLRVSQKGDWHKWILFFLDGVKTEAGDAIRRARKLLKMREDLRLEVQRGGATGNLLTLIDLLFQTPAISIPIARDKLGLSYRGAQLNVRKLEQMKFLSEATGFERNKIYVAKPILDILQSDVA